MTTEGRPRHPAAVARILAVGLASASTLALTAGMAVPPRGGIPTAADASVAPGVLVVRRLDTGMPARPAPVGGASTSVRSRTRGS